MEEIDIKNIEEYVNNYIDANKDIEFSEKIFSYNNIQLENHYEQSQNDIQLQYGVFSKLLQPSVSPATPHLKQALLGAAENNKIIENYIPSILINNYNSGEDLLEFSDNITSIKNIDIKQTLKKGQKILDKNEFFYDLDKIMTDKKFRTFYEKYFKDIVDIKVILLYMKLYETIQKEYFVIHNTEIDNKLLAYMIKELMNNNICRDKIMKSFHNFLESETEPKNRNNYKKFLLDFFDKKNK